MYATPPLKRRGAFGLISYITPVALPVFLVFFYTPFIASIFKEQGWNRGEALGWSLFVTAGWMAVGQASIALIPPRFAKLNFALQFLVFGLPLLGVFGIAAWVMLRLLWHVVR